MKQRKIFDIRKIKVLMILIFVLINFACNIVELNGINMENDGINVVVQSWAIFNIGNSSIPANEIKTIAIDNHNYIWIGTLSHGIARFDGSSWTNYDTSNSGLSNNSIQSIAIDYNSNVWVGTSNGLNKFDGINWTVYNGSNSILPYRIISSLAVDKKNVLWVGCGHFTSGGVLSFDGNNWKLYSKENSSLPSSIINVIHVDEENNKWIGTAAGLIKIDNQYSLNVYTKSNSNILFDGINAITTDLNNSVWIGANELERLDFEHYYGGLQKFDGKNWFDYRPHPNGDYNPGAIVSNRVDQLLCDRYGYLLIATETEWNYPYNLSFFKNGMWKNISSITENFPVNPFINDLKIDKSHTLWVATQLGLISITYTLK